MPLTVNTGFWTAMKSPMLSDITHRIRSISLIWKLLIPFLCLSFIGTTTLVYIGLTSQQLLIRQEEQKKMQRFYLLFLKLIDQKQGQALSMATIIAGNLEVQKLLSEKDRGGLTELCLPLYKDLKKDFGIKQFHFHISPGKSFLRLHFLEEFGEMISYRKEIIDAMKRGKGVGGLEWGLTGLGIRGVVPVYYNGLLAGSVEIGFPFGNQFFADLKRTWGPDFTVYEKRGEDFYKRLGTTLAKGPEFFPGKYLAGLKNDAPVILIAPDKYPHKSILLGPVKDYYGNVVALVKIDVDRSVITERLVEKRNLMILVGFAGLFLSFLLTWAVASVFVRPIKEIVKEAREIAKGKREVRLGSRPMDEIGKLAHSLNMMLGVLRERRAQIEEYARTLELRVQERTADLVASEEKYRELVKNLPLIVYRVLDDGTTEYINPYFTQKIGYTAEEVVGDRNFWREQIGDNGEGQEWVDGQEFRVERVVRNKQGDMLTFIDQGTPRKDEQGKVRWIDGIMMDITELKRLQGRALRTEEIRVSGEISARFAHEIRNPLSTAGGFARRLRDALPKDDPNQKIASIIVGEVARLEEILRITLASIEPFALTIEDVDMDALFGSLLKELDDLIKKRGIDLKVSVPSSVPRLHGDEGLLNKAFGALLKHAILSMAEGERLFLSMSEMNDHLMITISHKGEALSEDDLDQFFFPRFAGRAGSAVLDLPLSKVIIHRHGGKIDVLREDGNMIVFRIELPLFL
ncbi:MAG: PAS domain S-box protein [Desulfobacterales bacterium]|nr:PAS domain S-box protein [Desulfobacterales bacterium]